MAIKKKFVNGSKYYYAAISYIGYAKNVREIQGLEHQIQVDLFVKDELDQDYSEVENQLSYRIPLEKYVLDRKTQASIIDESYVDPLAENNSNPEGYNLTKVCYEWLKNNIELFKDFNNC